MASYVEKVLTTGENVEYIGKVSLWTLLPYIAVGVLLLPIYGIGLIAFLIAAVKYYSTELAITNKRVIAKVGFIRRSTVEINLQKIESIQVNQGVIGRIFNFGTVIISGAGSPQAPITGISKPLEFRRAFIDAQESALNPTVVPNTTVL